MWRTRESALIPTWRPLSPIINRTGANRGVRVANRGISSLRPQLQGRRRRPCNRNRNSLQRSRLADTSSVNPCTSNRVCSS
jgi:hypothetical protein